MSLPARSRRSRSNAGTDISPRTDGGRTESAGGNGPYAALNAVLNFLYPQLPPRQGLIQVIGQLEGQLQAGRGCAAGLTFLGVPIAATTALCNAATALGIDIVSFLRRQL